MKRLRHIFAACLLCCGIAATTSCDDYLDELPDNRSEIVSADKVQKLLTSSYLTNDPLLIAEIMSDNVDSYGPTNPNTSRFMDQLYSWSDITESNNESPEMIWEDCYERIATVNLALQAIEEMGGATTTELKEAQGEALVCRAYLHFVLVNLFGHAYNQQTSQNDPGVAYLTHTVSAIDANPPRNTVAEVYKLIDADLQQGLPLLGSNYSVPKYHFTPRAAYAFAARFYLYYEQWDKVIDYATRCLGSAPEAMLRDWAYMATMTQTSSAITQHYIDASLNCNLLLLTGYSSMGLIFGPYRYMSKYSHGKYLAEHEDGEAANIWGSATPYQEMSTYSATNLDKTIFWKLPYLFEYTDPVAGIGYYHTVYPAFTCDEALLNRAEAYVLTEQYGKAAQDLTTWMQNFIETGQELSPEEIQAFYNAADYSYSDEKGLVSTIKKHLHPKFDIGAEGEMKEAMLQCVLGFRRIETLQTGLRWYDVKRYGIEIVRRIINANGQPEELTDVLAVDDPRRAVQIPQKVRKTYGKDGSVTQDGVEPNPR